MGGVLIPVTLNEMGSEALAEALKASSIPMMLDVGWLTMLQTREDAKDVPDILVHDVVPYMTGLYVVETEFSQTRGKLSEMLLFYGTPFPIVISKVATASV